MTKDYSIEVPSLAETELTGTALNGALNMTNPHTVLRHHVTDAIERGEKTAIAGQPINAACINARMFRQAITTQWFGPSNVRGSRVRAKCEAKTIFVPWDHSLNIDQNHTVAAMTLAGKLGWHGQWVGGSIAGSGYAFTLLDEA